MAPVNPPIKPEDPKEYIRYSQDVRPGEDIRPRGQEQAQIKPTGVTVVDESGKYAYGRAGSLIEGGAKLADFALKGVDATIRSDIDTKAWDAASAVRNEYGDALKILKSTGVSKAVGSLLTEEEIAGGDVPEEIADGIAQAGTLKGANAAGKISNTYYLAQLESRVVKPLRDKYPGYREYIDKEVAQITGLHPANDWIRSMVRDINAAGAAANRQANRDEAFMDKHNDAPSMPIWRQEYRANGGNSDLLRYRVNRWQATESEIKRQELMWNFDDKYRIYLKGQATDTAHLSASSTVATALESAEIKIFGDEGASPAKIADTFRKIASGELPPPDEKRKAQLVMGMDDLIRRTEETLKVKMNEIRGKTPSGSQYSYNSILGDDATKIANQHLEGLKRIRNSIATGDYTLANYESHMIKGRIDSQKLKALTAESIGDDTTNATAISQLDPELGRIVLKHIAPNFATNIDAFLKKKIDQPAIDAVTKPDPLTGITPVTMKDGVEAAARAGITPEKVGKKVTADSYRQITSFVDKITDDRVSPIDKQKIAIWAFSPGNQGIVSLFGKDGLQLYSGLTSSGIAAEVAKMPAHIQQQYVNFVERTFGNELFRDELTTLKNVSNWTGVQITWDGKNLGARYQQTTPPILGFEARRSMIDRAIGRLNQGLSGLDEVYGTVAKDVDKEERLIKMLRGFDPTKVNTEGFPQKVIDSIIQFRTGAEDVERARKKKYGG
jgi:hypothetical protein